MVTEEHAGVVDLTKHSTLKTTNIPPLSFFSMWRLQSWLFVTLGSLSSTCVGRCLSLALRLPYFLLQASGILSFFFSFLNQHAQRRLLTMWAFWFKLILWTPDLVGPSRPGCGEETKRSLTSSFCGKAKTLELMTLRFFFMKSNFGFSRDNNY